MNRPKIGLYSLITIVFVFSGTARAEDAAKGGISVGKECSSIMPMTNQENASMVIEINNDFVLAEPKPMYMPDPQNPFLSHIMTRLGNLSSNETRTIIKNEDGELRKVIFDDNTSLEIDYKKNDLGELQSVTMKYTNGNTVLTMAVAAEDITVSFNNFGSDKDKDDPDVHHTDPGMNDKDKSVHGPGPIKSVDFGKNRITIKYRVPEVSEADMDLDKFDKQFFSDLGKSLENTRNKLQSEYESYKNRTAQFYKMSSIILKQNKESIEKSLGKDDAAAFEKAVDNNWKDSPANRIALDTVCDKLRDTVDGKVQAYDDISRLLNTIDRLRDNMVNSAIETYRINQEDALNQNISDITRLIREHKIIMAVQKGKGRASDTIKAVIDLSASGE